MNRSIFAAVVGLPLLFVLVVISLGVFFPRRAGGDPLPVPKSAPFGISEADATKLPPAKRKLWDDEKRREELARQAAAPTPANPGHVLLPVPTRKPVEPGIVPSGQGPLPSVYTFQNFWHGMAGGQSVAAYFGALRDDPAQGVVLIARERLDGKSAGTTLLRTPAKRGALRAISFDGNVVTASTEKGDTVLVDAGAGAFASLPESAACCSLLLDMDPATPGIQATRTVTGQQDISIDVVLGDTVGELGGFNFSLVYDDTRLTPVVPGAGGINGNPDFNDAALGAGWNCSMPGTSGRADIDAATGPGHGVAFLSCFVTGAPPSVSTATVVATLQLRVTATGASEIAISDANFAHYDATEIGTCNPVVNVELTCAGGSVTRE